MENLLTTAGRLIGAVGVVLCALTMIWRLLGNYHLGGFQLATLFQAGTSTVVIGCFLLLVARVDHR
jgi:mannose/fructose/N-acetylgalactosamine-specific phosphotransferase system component IIC